MSTSKDLAVLAKLGEIAGCCNDQYEAVVRLCEEWSDGNCRSLMDTYQYVKAKDPANMDIFMSGLRAWARGSG